MKNVWTSLKAPIKSLLRLEKREVSKDVYEAASLPEAMARKSRNVSTTMPREKVLKMFLYLKMETFFATSFVGE